MSPSRGLKKCSRLTVGLSWAFENISLSYAVPKDSRLERSMLQVFRQRCPCW